MPARKPKPVADRDELLRILTESAREGSVTACKTLLEELRRDAGTEDDKDDLFADLDNVAPLRRRA
jgi:hypothetical protein